MSAQGGNNQGSPNYLDIWPGSLPGASFRPRPPDPNGYNPNGSRFVNEQPQTPPFMSKPFAIEDSQQFPQMSRPFIQNGGQAPGMGSPGMTGVPSNSVANMFGNPGQAQSFFDSIRKYAPGQQAAQGSTAPMPGPQGKGIIIAEDSQPQYSPAPWQPAQTPNYLQPNTAAFLYGANPWQRTDPRQVWSGGAGGQWGLQPGYNGVK